MVYESEKMGTLHKMSRKPTILTAYRDGPDDFVEVSADDIEVPEEVALELLRVGAIDYATAKTLTVQGLFDLLME